MQVQFRSIVVKTTRYLMMIMSFILLHSFRQKMVGNIKIIQELVIMSLFEQAFIPFLDSVT